MPGPGAAAACRDGRDEAEWCLSPAGRLAAAVCLGGVGSRGFCSNPLVLLLFWRFPALGSPINLLLLNNALSDLWAAPWAPRSGWLRGQRGSPAPGTASPPPTAVRGTPGVRRMAGNTGSAGAAPERGRDSSGERMREPQQLREASGRYNAGSSGGRTG